MTEAYFEAIAKKDQNIPEKEDTTLSLPSKEASPVVEGPLDASKDTILSSALNDVPLEVVFAVHDDEEVLPVVLRKLIHGIIIVRSGSVCCNLEESNIVATYGNDMGITNYGPRLKDEAIKKLKERTHMSKKRLKI
ncbi:hypothetical protein Tco_0050403 [Tanacetum coccineum]